MNKDVLHPIALKAGLICEEVRMKLHYGEIRFAEEIVRACAEVASCNGHVSGFSLGDLIKEHFGLKNEQKS